MTYFLAKPKLLALLQMGGASTTKFTSEQIVEFLGKYIESKKLYDPHNKRIIHCKNDLLGEVFQLDEFVVGDFRSLWKCISPNLSIVSKKDSPVKETTSSKDFGECSSNETELPWWYFVKKERVNDETNLSQTTGRRSYDLCDTIVAHDTEYEESEVEFLEEYEPVYSDDSDTTVPVTTDDENFEDADGYNPERFNLSDSSSSESEASSHTSDFGFDPDIDLEEWWRCHECNTKNMPTVGYCMRCWKLRKGWATNRSSIKRSATEPIVSHHNKSSNIDVPDGVERKKDEVETTPLVITPSLPSFSVAQKRKPDEGGGYVDAKKLHREDAGSSDNVSLQTNSSLAASSDGSDVVGLCNICRNNPNDSCIVHGRTGHQFCCYRCARRLQKRGDRCPVCRQEIAFVLKNYVMKS